MHLTAQADERVGEDDPAPASEEYREADVTADLELEETLDLTRVPCLSERSGLPADAQQTRRLPVGTQPADRVRPPPAPARDRGARQSLGHHDPPPDGEEDPAQPPGRRALRCHRALACRQRIRVHRRLRGPRRPAAVGLGHQRGPPGRVPPPSVNTPAPASRPWPPASPLHPVGPSTVGAVPWSSRASPSSSSGSAATSTTAAAMRLTPRSCSSVRSTTRRRRAWSRRGQRCRAPGRPRWCPAPPAFVEERGGEAGTVHDLHAIELRLPELEGVLRTWRPTSVRAQPVAPRRSTVKSTGAEGEVTWPSPEPPSVVLGGVRGEHPDHRPGQVLRCEHGEFVERAGYDQRLVLRQALK